MLRRVSLDLFVIVFFIRGIFGIMVFFFRYDLVVVVVV